MSDKANPASGSAVAGRLKLVDLLRLISIIAVMALHFSLHQPINEHWNWSQAAFVRFLEEFGRRGIYGVSLFFVISGFVISRMVHLRYGGLFSISARDFYFRRIARIWPLLVTMVIVGLSVVFAVNATGAVTSPDFNQIFSPQIANFDVPFYASICTFTNNILFDWRPHQYGLHWVIWWSLAVEEQFYLLFPLILRSLRDERKLVKLLLLLVVLGPIARCFSRAYGPGAALIVSFGSYDLLSIGVLLFLAVARFGDRIKQSQTLAATLFGIGLILTPLVYFGRNLDSSVDYAIAPTLFGLGAFLLILGGLTWRPINLLPSFLCAPGQLSYGMYLYHPLVMLGTVALFGSLLHDRVTLFGAFILMNLLMGAASYFMYENPLNSLVYRSLKKLNAVRTIPETPATL